MDTCNDFPFSKKFHQAISVSSQNTARASDGHSSESGEAGRSYKWILKRFINRNILSIFQGLF